MAEKEKQVSKLKALINRTKTDSTKVNTAIVLDTRPLEGTNTAEVQAKLVSTLRKLSDRIAIHDDILRPEFGRNGYFDKAFDGESAFLKDTGLFDTANFLFLCRLEAKSSTNATFGQMFSCRVELTYRVFTRDAKLVDSGSVHAVGPGFSANEALLRGIEILVEKNGSNLIRFLAPETMLSP